MSIIPALIALAPIPALADMSAAEFEAYVTGKTLTYTDRGVVYGIEEYLPNRRVRWAFINDECRYGVWYEEAGQICFVYENAPDTPQCWRFSEDGGRLRAEFTGGDNGRSLYEAETSEEPMICLGPDVGV